MRFEKTDVQRECPFFRIQTYEMNQDYTLRIIYSFFSSLSEIRLL